MSKFYEEKEVIKIIAEIEIESRAEFANDPTKAFETLEKLLKKYVGNEAIKNKIEALQQEFRQALVFKEEMARISQPTLQPVIKKSTSTKSIEEKIQEIKQSQEEIQKELNDLITKEGSVVANKEGQALEKKEIKSGEEREAVIAHLDHEDVGRISEKVTQIYEHFAKLGFNVYNRIVEKMDAGGKIKTAVVFGIEMPPGYSGNADPLTMNADQIRLATQLLNMERKVGEKNEDIPLQNGITFVEILGSLDIEDLTAEFKKDFDSELTRKKLGETPKTMVTITDSKGIANSTVFTPTTQV